MTKKMPSTFFNMLLALILSSVISSLTLAGVFLLTKDKIQEVKTQEKIMAFKNILPLFDNNPYDDQYTVHHPEGDFTFYPAKKDNAVVGVAIETWTKQGYAGDIRLLVGFLPNGSIYRAVVTSHKETPGLGSKMLPSESSFSSQFDHQDPAVFQLKVKKDGGDVDAITAATITSRAYCDAMARAYRVFQKEMYESKK